MLDEYTVCVPYYRQPRMLATQLAEWEGYPEDVRFIVVDDGSPVDPALPVVMRASHDLRQRIDLYRITKDIPWNRGGARNLATREARTDWIVHIDIDHILTAASARRMQECRPDPKAWYRFERYRVGPADETRKKDRIDPSCAFGKIHPHIDSYLITQNLYWRAGGYNEAFSGCLGGGSPFLAELEKITPPRLMRPDVHLHVYTRHAVADASVTGLSRDRLEYARRKLQLRGNLRGGKSIQFSWVKEAISTLQ